ncbi:8316_t:CDS:10 [Paraglomus occultum]|uniref:8316_t:CDS:1 n=1 Tax=Paraglomus occultum TaxID=144539 RepID=A0A9N8Z0D9_9GLOM|nr:8316_t:CDS:10 [Paraglomus occultum]
MSLWVDKYRPSKLEDLEIHESLSERLRTLSSSSDFPHLLVYGPSGSGKKTRIVCVLRELFGDGVLKIKNDVRIFLTPSRVKKQLVVVSSNYHIEVTPSDLGSYDRQATQELLKEIAQTQQIAPDARHRFKVVIINEADLLSREAQASLRRTMEKYMKNLRIILCCNSTSKVIAPIRSRCLLVRVPAPTNDQIVHVLKDILKKENVNLSEPLITRVAEHSHGNLRKAILSLETAVTRNETSKADDKVGLTDWEVAIEDLAKTILLDQSQQTMLQVRTKFYELISACIPASTILKTLAFSLAKRAKIPALKPRILMEAAFYEHRLRLGNKAIFHLEAFGFKIMRLILLFESGMQ